GSRSDVAKQFAASVNEIFIDEYQDSNGVQGDILRAVSGVEDGRYNIFMVGDVKQSIYRFRMAKPELFMEKYDTYSLEEGPERRIDLHNNFRSRNEVIESVNFIFRQLMHNSVGKVEYDKAAELVTGAGYPDDPGQGSYNTEFLILESGEGGRLSGYAKIQAEARMVALRIKRMVESGTFFVKQDEKILRPVRYGDIAILLRSAKGWKDVLSQVLEEAGIPLKETSATGYFNAPEVMVTLSLLELIDNEMQDVPLAAVLKSPVCGFTSKELAKIRANHPKGSFYSAVAGYRKGITEGDNEISEEIKERLDQFFDMLSEFRNKAVFLPVNELIELVVTSTGYLDFVAAMPGGKMRRENILMLMERAVAFESTSFKGLFNFLRYIDRMKKYEIEFPEPESTAEYEDKVRIMTIHKSKGLEVPVVFLCGTSKQFNRADKSAPVVLHSDMGAGIDYIDPDRRVKYHSLVKNVLSSRVELEDMGEELRVLYVAMTRPKEKLIITTYTDNAENKFSNYGYIADSETLSLGFSDISGAGSFSDWLFMSLVRPSEYIEVHTE
ncbi:MAG: UvrD-helicase domain-containing protein, partial [Lachnospiraceae bacterium]|nr:UvrD-helicase domain-containing protein [Lachnospiraceae bacterium]